MCTSGKPQTLQHYTSFCNMGHLMTRTQRLSLGGWRVKQCCFVAACWCWAPTVSFEDHCSRFPVKECGGKQSFFSLNALVGNNFTQRASNLWRHTQPFKPGVFFVLWSKSTWSVVSWKGHLHKNQHIPTPSESSIFFYLKINIFNCTEKFLPLYRAWAKASKAKTTEEIFIFHSCSLHKLPRSMPLK